LKLYYKNILIFTFIAACSTDDLQPGDLDPPEASFTYTEDFDTKLLAAYNNAIDNGLWDNTYAQTNELEYWAEGVQSWYNVNIEATPTNGIHNYVDTHEELKDYDPWLFDLISIYFNPPDQTNPSCN